MKLFLNLFLVALLSFGSMSFSDSNPKNNDQSNNEVVVENQNDILCYGPWSDYVQLENCREGTFGIMIFERERDVYSCKTGELFTVEVDEITVDCP